ncbi:RAP domain-containing protein, partial [Haematococcus lacustris]
MFHLYLWLKDQPDPEVVKVADSLPRDFRQHALKVWRQQTTEKQVTSEYQQQVLQALSDMGLEPQIERKTRDWLFSIDVCLKLGDVLVAVEVNGPLHYSASLPWRPTGKKLLRNAFLARRGYRVVDVAWWQWQRVTVDQDRAQQYLRDLLEDAVVTPLDRDHWAAGAGLHGS